MSRMVKCRICGNELLQTEAYKVTITKENGKKINKYYCDSIELETYEQETLQNKQEKDDVFNIINEILGYKCLNFNTITKELTPILKVYSYKEIHNCFCVQKDRIISLLNMKDIDKEFNKIRYIFTVLTGNIADDTNDLKNKIEQQSIKKIKSEDINIDDLPFSDYKHIEPKGTDFSSFF